MLEFNANDAYTPTSPFLSLLGNKYLHSSTHPRATGTFKNFEVSVCFKDSGYRY